ncbi:MAG: cytochrome c [Nitrosospira sp.]|nr:cytochrome c [Nitrosospira sp.]MBI0418609.1 cytochrome c [Nitrosospira sp.]
MNVMKSLSPSQYCRHLLLGITTVFIIGCNESPSSKSVNPSNSLLLQSSTVSSAIAPSETDTPPLITDSIQQSKNLVMDKLDPEKIKHGALIYRVNCANCHGPKGEAAPGWRNPGTDGKYPPPPLDDSAHAWHHSTDTLEKMIREGSPPGAGGMPGWDDKLTNQEIADVIVWIKSTWSEEIYGTWYQEIEKKQQQRQGKKQH